MQRVKMSEGTRTGQSQHCFVALCQRLGRNARSVVEAVTAAVCPQGETELHRRREQALIGSIRPGGLGYVM
jgi:hypothetical protein